MTSTPLLPTLVRALSTLGGSFRPSRRAPRRAPRGCGPGLAALACCLFLASGGAALSCTIGPDTDLDGVRDVCDADDDDDGILDADEGAVRAVRGFETPPVAAAGSPDRHRTGMTQFGIDEAAFEGDWFVGLHSAPDDGTTSAERLSVAFSGPLNPGATYRVGFVQAVGRLNALTFQQVWVDNDLGDNPGYFELWLGDGVDSRLQRVHVSGVVPGDDGAWRLEAFRFVATAAHTHMTIVALGTTAKAPYMLMDAFTFFEETDSDLDTVPDRLDLDSDNDGIPDTVEAQPTGAYRAAGGTRDANGVDTRFSGGLVPVNTDAADGDAVPDHLDLDSDGDGLFDIAESGLATIDANGDGRTDGPVGANGLDDAAEAADTYADPDGAAHDGAVFALADSDGDTAADGAGAAPPVADLDYRDTASLDRSDAPVAGTAYGSATHVIVPGLHLGARVDGEATDLAGPGADGDDTDGADDEDGVTIPPLTLGQATTIAVSVAQPTPGGGYLQGWIDWNGDGAFGAGERVARDLRLAAGMSGTIAVPVVVPATARTGRTFARLRWSTVADLDATTAAPDGEVEDHALTVSAAASGFCAVPPNIVFIADDSGSVDATERAQMSTALQAIADGIEATYPATRIGLLQYGQPATSTPDDGDYAVVLPYTVNPTIALTDDVALVQDHLPDTLDRMIGDGLFSTGGQFDDPDAFFIFTDALRTAPGCCSALENSGSFASTDADPGFQEYANLATLANSGVVSVFHSQPDPVDAAPQVAQGDGVYRFSSDFSVTQQDIDQIVGSLCAPPPVDHSDAPADGSTAPDGTPGATAYGTASHGIAGIVRLGATVDAERAPLASVAGDGDDADGADDEDGVTIPPLTRGGDATILATVTGAGGRLQAWIDWNGDGAFGAGERVANDLADGGALDTDAAAGRIAFSVAVPASATTAPTVSRFRWSTTGGLDSTGTAVDGEVEDHALTVQPPAPSPFQSCSGWQDPYSYMEVSAVTASGATGSLLSNVDGTPLAVDVASSLSNLLPASSRMDNAFPWNGFGGTGAYDPDPSGSDGIAHGNDGSYTVSFSRAVENPIVSLYSLGRAGQTVTWRFTDPMGAPLDMTIRGTPANLTQTAPDTIAGAEGHGTVQFGGTIDGFVATVVSGGPEVYAALLPGVLCGEDFSDAPISTTRYGGASHGLDGATRLGAAVDTDPADLDTPNADGDGADDDGVALPLLTRGQMTTIPVTVAQTRAGSGYLQAWIDWNGDGDFDDRVAGTDERVAVDLQSATAGTSVIAVPVTVPIDAATTRTFARFRWSTTPALDATTRASDGEVEDYALTVSARPEPVIATCAAPPRFTGSRYLPAGLTTAGGTMDVDTAGAPAMPVDVSAVTGPGSGFAFRGFASGGIRYTHAPSVPGGVLGNTFGFARQTPVRLRAGPDNDAGNSAMNQSVETITFLARGATPGFAWVVGSIRDGTATVSPDGLSVSVAAGSGLDQTQYDIASNGSLMAMDVTRHSRVATNDNTLFHLDAVTCYDLADGPFGGNAPHRVEGGLALGGAVDIDPVPLASPDAGGDGADDDGVVLPVLLPGGGGTITVNVTGVGGYLQAWIDWDGNGAFDSPAEQIATDLRDRGTGTIAISVAVPPTATTAPTFARFRWSSDFGIGPNGIAPDGEVEDHPLTLGAGGPALGGRLFRDDGAGGGAAFDAIPNGGEAGGPVASVALSDGAGAPIGTAAIGPDGAWSFALPPGHSGPVTVQATPLPGWLSVSERTAGLPGLVDADPRDGAFAFTPAPGTPYRSLDLGFVPAPVLTQDRRVEIVAGQAIVLLHRYAATGPGAVTFALVDAAANPANGFASAIFLDAGCDGALDGPLAGPVAVVAGQQVCVGIRTQVGSGVGPGASLSYGLTATTAFAGIGIVHAARNDDRIGSGGDVLLLRKLVTNLTIPGAVEGTSGIGNVGDRLRYRILFRNPGSAPAKDIVISDTTPAYTALADPIASPVVVAPGMTCTVRVPATGNAAGYVGPIEWMCPGSFPPGLERSVTFEVTIAP